VARLGAERHLPLIEADGDAGAPRYRLDAVDRYDRRHDLFNAVAPFEDDDAIQSAFAAARRHTLKVAERAITIARNEPFEAGQSIGLNDFGPNDEDLQRTILLMRQNADFVAMIERVRLFWADWHRERRRKAAMTPPPVSLPIPDTSEVEAEVLRPQHLEYPTKRSDGAER
jgi:hypothetical protein